MSEKQSSAIKITGHLLLVCSILSLNGNRFHYILLYFMEIQHTEYAKRENHSGFSSNVMFTREENQQNAQH